MMARLGERTLTLVETQVIKVTDCVLSKFLDPISCATCRRQLLVLMTHWKP